MVRQLNTGKNQNLGNSRSTGLELHLKKNELQRSETDHGGFSATNKVLKLQLINNTI